MILPAGFNGTCAAVHVAAADAGAGVAPGTVRLPVIPAGQTVAGQVTADSVALWTGISFDNRSGGNASAAESAELARYSALATARAGAANWNNGLRDMAPPEDGGNVSHQAAQGKLFLQMAGKLNDVADRLENMATASDDVVVTDGRATFFL